MKEQIEDDAMFRCTVCGQIGTVGRCCGLDTREPLNELARARVVSDRKANDELREIAKALSGALQIAVRESDMLRRQVEVLLLAWKNSASCSSCVLVRKESGKAAAANYCQYTTDCANTMRQWSMEHAKVGGGE